MIVFFYSLKHFVEVGNVCCCSLQSFFLDQAHTSPKTPVSKHLMLGVFSASTWCPPYEARLLIQAFEVTILQLLQCGFLNSCY